MLRKQFIRSLMISGIATGLISCAGTPAASSQPTAVATIAFEQPTPQPTIDVGALVATPDTTASGNMATAVSGTGEIKTLNDADLNFQVTGIVAEILVKEGDSIKKDTLVATLDTALYDQQVAQAQANLVSAKATLAGFQPDGPDSRAAKAQLAQAQATIDATKPGATSADIDVAQLSLNAARLNLKSTGDRLSLAKTQAQLQLDLASQTVAQATAQFLIDQFNWKWIQDKGTYPYNPSAGSRPNRINDASTRQYESLYDISSSKRDAALISFKSAQIGYEQAVQAEQVGIETAQQQVAQAELSFRRLTQPIGKDRAVIEAALAVAQATVNRLTVQRAQAEAGVAQAEAALTLANLNRQRAEIRAPFDGVVSFINVSVGDPANLAGRAPVQLIDATNLQAEVQISDVDIGGVTLNQNATVTVDAMQGKQYPGVVTFISPIATVIGNARLYTVHIKLTDIVGLRAGMSARISLIGK
ncbi:MAG: HlyD family efflux transporter periplasmic adaptor subunit [Chloroflexales bacterium]|nr:HlyD family efflux transporter periplasmic adaptor subunit [Chloroflexales bacterium]